MRILVLANFGMGLYNFRKELLEELIRNDNDVYISFPHDEYVPKLESLGCKFINIKLDRRGTNPFSDLKVVFNYMRMIKRIKPDIVLTYTIKPNVYGGIACILTNHPYISNITGLGTAVENKGLIQNITLTLYKTGLRKASCVFFQNKTNREFFIKKNIVKNNSRLIPGSGVNLVQHKFEEYPAKTDKKIRFLFIGRIMKAKGIEELLEAAKVVKEEYPNTEFNLIGGMEEDYSQIINVLEKQGIVKYHGQQDDVQSFIKKSHGTILPSYHEGLANVLLESASAGRPVMTSRIPGCLETFDENISGIGFEVRDTQSLKEAIIKFINLPYDQKKKMGIAGRKKMEREFNRRSVVQAYIDEIKTAVYKEN
ncbi:glycosyltransferase family 4 protein [Oceanobacillus caeni]|uniref:glycosyltransferase family 4 protein n=1 Tax=Oceanobacillus caeni TaxID=405946 RepID=UPI003624B379